MPDLASYDYAVIRIVPRVEREEFLNAGVILFCRTRIYLGAQITLDAKRLRALAPWLDVTEVEQSLAFIPLVCAGDRAAGEIGRLPLAGRFHWLVAPRSTMIQMSPVHSGLCDQPADMLDHLAKRMIADEPR